MTASERIPSGRVFALVLLTMLLGAQAIAADPPPKAKAPPGNPRAAKEPPRPRLGKIVFIGKQDACDCTHDRVQAGWGALQAALKDRPAIPVVALDVDRDKGRYEPYRRQRPVAVVPAVYFLDEKERVLELSEGELDAKELKRVLDGEKISSRAPRLKGKKAPTRYASRGIEGTADHRRRDHRSGQKPLRGTPRSPQRHIPRTAHRPGAAAG
jgi:hypothetical protein